MAAIQIVYPGSLLAQEGQVAAGEGCYTRNGKVYSSLAGVVSVQDGVVRVVQSKENTVVPRIGDLVTGKVTKISKRIVHLNIMLVNQTPLESPYKGLLRIEDVRAIEKDAVDIARSFRPNDIIVAEVLSMGDSRNYYLTTAKEHLGVIYATSVAGYPMKPYNWQEMVCVHSGIREWRKVAKPEADIA
mmetsp:Transcript_86537/g.150672  ORF Transcript_86537/g.150672 Transcript_86537/m.150672 type:complete len:187 (-) Transcript_86537:355-915(-)